MAKYNLLKETIVVVKHNNIVVDDTGFLHDGVMSSGISIASNDNFEISSKFVKPVYLSNPEFYIANYSIPDNQIPNYINFTYSLDTISGSLSATAISGVVTVQTPKDFYCDELIVSISGVSLEVTELVLPNDPTKVNFGKDGELEQAYIAVDETTIYTLPIYNSGSIPANAYVSLPYTTSGIAAKLSVADSFSGDHLLAEDVYKLNYSTTHGGAEYNFFVGDFLGTYSSEANRLALDHGFELLKKMPAEQLNVYFKYTSQEEKDYEFEVWTQYSPNEPTKFYSPTTVSGGRLYMEFDVVYMNGLAVVYDILYLIGLTDVSLSELYTYTLHGEDFSGKGISCAVDFDYGYIWLGKDGVWLNNGDPEQLLNPTYSGITGPLLPMFFRNDSSHGGDVFRLRFNFGQFPFKYTKPSGYDAFATFDKKGAYCTIPFLYEGGKKSNNVVLNKNTPKDTEVRIYARGSNIEPVPLEEVHVLEFSNGVFSFDSHNDSTISKPGGFVSTTIFSACTDLYTGASFMSWKSGGYWGQLAYSRIYSRDNTDILGFDDYYDAPNYKTVTDNIGNFWWASTYIPYYNDSAYSLNCLYYKGDNVWERRILFNRVQDKRVQDMSAVYGKPLLWYIEGFTRKIYLIDKDEVVYATVTTPFNNPETLASNKNGEVFVGEGKKVYKYNVNGNYVLEFELPEKIFLLEYDLSDGLWALCKDGFLYHIDADYYIRKSVYIGTFDSVLHSNINRNVTIRPTSQHVYITIYLEKKTYIIDKHSLSVVKVYDPGQYHYLDVFNINYNTINETTAVKSGEYPRPYDPLWSNVSGTLKWKPIAENAPICLPYDFMQYRFELISKDRNKTPYITEAKITKALYLPDVQPNNYRDVYVKVDLEGVGKSSEEDIDVKVYWEG